MRIAAAAPVFLTRANQDTKVFTKAKAASFGGATPKPPALAVVDSRTEVVTDEV